MGAILAYNKASYLAHPERLGANFAKLPSPLRFRENT